MQLLHHRIGTYSNAVDRYIALTEFSKEKFVQGGLPVEKIAVKPNSLAHDPGLGSGHADYVLFVGRISKEKGVRTLIEAWRELPGIRLVIAGDGPLLGEIRERVNQLGANIKFEGQLDRKRILELMGEARMLIVPSEWYEGFPMTIIEAYARGLPVVASSIGSLEEVVIEDETGVRFNTGDPSSLAAVVRALFGDHQRIQRFRRGARERFLHRFSPEVNLKALFEVYGHAIQNRVAS